LGGLWALEYIKTVRATVLGGLWALEWETVGVSVLGGLWALEWAWSRSHSFGRFVGVRVGVA